MADRRGNDIKIPGLDVDRAKRYSRIRLGGLGLSVLWSVARFVWLASDRRAARFKISVMSRAPAERIGGPAFIASFATLSWLSNLPLAFVSGYFVERRFGLTRQPVRGWIGDQVKALVLSVLVQTPLLTAAFAVIRRRPRDWWLILAGASVPLMIVISNLTPVLMMPLFNRFEPLRDAMIAERVRSLAERSGVRVSDVYEMDMSRQSEKPNAMFAGLGNSKRIVLGDTLLDRFTPDEIDAVVAHELGHQVHGDIWRLIGFSAGAGFGAIWVLARITPAVLRQTRARTGVSDIGDAASLPVLALLTTAMGLVVMPLRAAFSRALERRADRYALELTRNGEAFARAMERLAVQALADPDPPRPVVLLLHSHPPIGDRIRVARNAELRFRKQDGEVQGAAGKGVTGRPR